MASDRPSDLVMATTEFGFDVYHRLVQESEEDNFVFSPAILHNSLTMLWAGTMNDTKEQLQKKLSFQKIDDVHSAAKLLKAILLQDKHSVLNIANNVFLQKGLQFVPRFADMLQDYYGAIPAVTDFEGQKAAQEINHWIRGHTAHEIRGVVRSNKLSPLAHLIVVSAMVFKSNWSKPFPKENACYLDFHLPGNRVCSTEMMSQEGMFSVGEDTALDCSILELPYAGETYSMVILLPRSKTGLSHLESKLTVLHLTSLPKPTKKSKVEVTLPKFRLESKTPVKTLYPDLRIFDNRLANLTGLNDTKRIHVTDAIHKVLFKLDPDQSDTNAPSTLAQSTPLRQSGGAKFIADRPFLFFIKHTATNCVLLLGRYTTPDQANQPGNGTLQGSLNDSWMDIHIPAADPDKPVHGYVNVNPDGSGGGGPGYVNVHTYVNTQSGSCQDLRPGRGDGYLKPISFNGNNRPDSDRSTTTARDSSRTDSLASSVVDTPDVAIDIGPAIPLRESLKRTSDIPPQSPAAPSGVRKESSVPQLPLQLKPEKKSCCILS